jgi:hypothetical protein
MSSDVFLWVKRSELDKLYQAELSSAARAKEIELANEMLGKIDQGQKSASAVASAQLNTKATTRTIKESITKFFQSWLPSTVGNGTNGNKAAE